MLGLATNVLLKHFPTLYWYSLLLPGLLLVVTLLLFCKKPRHQYHSFNFFPTLLGFSVVNKIRSNFLAALWCVTRVSGSGLCSSIKQMKMMSWFTQTLLRKSNKIVPLLCCCVPPPTLKNIKKRNQDHVYSCLENVSKYPLIPAAKTLFIIFTSSSFVVGIQDNKPAIVDCFQTNNKQRSETFLSSLPCPALSCPVHTKC